MSNGLLNGVGNPFQVFDPNDPTKMQFWDVSAIPTGNMATLLSYSITGSIYPTGATNEGNANDILFSGGGSGANNTWASPDGVLAHIVATSNLTSRTGVLGPTTIYAVPSTGAGMYRISWAAAIVTAATTSSVLGGTNGFQVIWTNVTDSVVKTSNPTTTTGMTTAGNTTGDAVCGVVVARCKASTNLQYQFDYTSVGGTSMAYDIFITVEYLGA